MDEVPEYEVEPISLGDTRLYVCGVLLVVPFIYHSELSLKNNMMRIK